MNDNDQLPLFGDPRDELLAERQAAIAQRLAELDASRRDNRRD